MRAFVLLGVLLSGAAEAYDQIIVTTATREISSAKCEAAYFVTYDPAQPGVPAQSATVLAHCSNAAHTPHAYSAISDTSGSLLYLDGEAFMDCRVSYVEHTMGGDTLIELACADDN